MQDLADREELPTGEWPATMKPGGPLVRNPLKDQAGYSRLLAGHKPAVIRRIILHMIGSREVLATLRGSIGMAKAKEILASAALVVIEAAAEPPPEVFDE